MLTDRQMDKELTNKSTELHPFRKEPSYDMTCLPVKFELDYTKRFRVRIRKRKC